MGTGTGPSPWSFPFWLSTVSSGDFELMYAPHILSQRPVMAAVVRCPSLVPQPAANGLNGSRAKMESRLIGATCFGTGISWSLCRFLLDRSFLRWQR
ncbi:hypothetical protein GCM10022254_06420 [Actinomadura meridiana]|uniref:Uncharacterized protein n=1 Tax=Actinomadura meridiana TaxID=559626 RepID=A0ABP8BSV3_9ACTN